MPQAEDDTGSELGLPFWLGGDDGVHEGEEARWGVGGLDVDVELDVLVLRLGGEGVKRVETERRGRNVPS